MYFATTPVPGYEKEFSERFCINTKDKKTYDDNAGDGSKVKNLTIPLWNVKRIDTNVLEDGGITDMTFTMRYTNISSPVGYYTEADAANVDLEWPTKVAAIEGLTDAETIKFNPPLTELQGKTMYVKHPEIFEYDATTNTLNFKIPPSYEDFVSGKFLGKYLDYTTKRFPETINVKFKEVKEADEP